MAALAIPLDLDELTPAWLTAALSASGVAGDATIASARAELIAVERGIGGRVARVRIEYAGPAPGAPRSIIAKLPSAIELTRAGGRFLRLPEREVRFYRELAGRVPVRTPECYFADVDADGDAFVLLLEDLGALPSGDDLAGTTVERAERVVDAVAGLHAAWWRSPDLDALEWMPAIDERGAIWQRMFASAWREHRDELGELVPDELLPLGEAMTRRLAAAVARLAASPATLLHGDLRLDNLFFPPVAGAPVAAVDWSNATRGPGPYDLAYFMCTAFEPEQRRACEQQLLRRYYDALAARGVEGYAFETCFDDYRLSFCEPFARMFFLLVRGHGEKDHRRPPAVLSKFVRNAGQAALDLDALALLED
jgi:hypothetical protein